MKKRSDLEIVARGFFVLFSDEESQMLLYMCVQDSSESKS